MKIGQYLAMIWTRI